MNTRRTFRLIALGAALSALAGGAFFLGSRRGAASPQAAAPPIECFSAPSHLPSGDHWVILGSRDVFPLDFTVTPAALDVSVLEVQRLSDHALAARVQVGATAAGALLHGTSFEGSFDYDLAVYRGQSVPELSSAENFSATDFQDGWLVLPTDRFLYGYLPSSEGGIAAVRVHNRASGEWSRREHALERAIAEAEAESAEPLPPGFVEPNPLETLPDTDGDGILDFEEAPEVAVPVPEQLGVALASGENLLDLVVFDEYGNASWSVIQVFSTHAPPPES